MKAFLTGETFLLIVLLIVCFAHFIDALSGRDWHVFLYGALTLVLLIALIIVLISGG